MSELDEDFGFFVSIDEKNRIIIPASIVKRRRLLTGDELFIQKRKSKIYIFFQEPKGEEYIGVTFRGEHGINLIEEAGLKFPGDKVKIIECNGGFVVYPLEKPSQEGGDE